ncbi:Beta-1,3-galactosyltransferase 1 [Mizuhopecten yessoensis]|uniref:Hexosyltransferase n=2 Tax=Mizuhopecten yessoensis TaxID=6573 RepID=A0A210R4K0_MIZYE|nr:Beta-1,3-galactosyltransferase 1 [Mizuhopecten yessoensis]
MILITKTQSKKAVGGRRVLTANANPVETVIATKTVNTENLTTRPQLCDKCFLHNFTLLLDNEDICNTAEESGYEADIDVLILVTTTHAHYSQREAMRTSWLTDTKNNKGNVRYAFLLGISASQTENVQIKQENGIYHDILQEIFIDSYKNLTYKTMMALKWAKTRCAHAWHILKTDDDVYVNIPGLLKSLKTHAKALLSAVGGTCPNMAFPVRDKDSKFYVDIETYPGKYYPTYCSGTAYIMSMTVAKCVLEISENIPFFPIEDIYIAFCIHKLGFRFVNIGGFHRFFITPNMCNYKSDWFVTSHGVNPQLVKDVWKTIC